MNLASTHQHGQGQLCKTQTSDALLLNGIMRSPALKEMDQKSILNIYDVGKRHPHLDRFRPEQVIMEGDHLPTVIKTIN